MIIVKKDEDTLRINRLNLLRNGGKLYRGVIVGVPTSAAVHPQIDDWARKDSLLEIRGIERNQDRFSGEFLERSSSFKISFISEFDGQPFSDACLLDKREGPL